MVNVHILSLEVTPWDDGEVNCGLCGITHGPMEDLRRWSGCLDTGSLNSSPTLTYINKRIKFICGMLPIPSATPHGYRKDELVLQLASINNYNILNISEM